MSQNSNAGCNSSNTPCQKSPSYARGEGLSPFCLFVRIRPKVIMVVLGKVASRRTVGTVGMGHAAANTKQRRVTVHFNGYLVASAVGSRDT